MQSDPLVSIIMPAYNAERFLAEAVQSVIDQSWKNWELIIVNDGSSDGTRTYLDTLEDPRIRVIHQDNAGVSAARNVAIDVAKGEFMTLLDADDVLPTSSLEVRAKYLTEHSNVDLVDGALSFRDEKLSFEKRLHMPGYRGQLLPRLIRLDDTVFAGTCYFFRRDLLGETRFKNGMTHLEDLLFFIHLSFHQDVHYGFVDDLVYLYRTGHQSAMSDISGLEEGYCDLLYEVSMLQCVSRIDLILLRLKIAKIIFLCWLNANNLKNGLSGASKCLFNAMSKKPTNWGLR